MCHLWCMDLVSLLRTAVDTRRGRVGRRWVYTCSVVKILQMSFSFPPSKVSNLQKIHNMYVGDLKSVP